MRDQINKKWVAVAAATIIGAVATALFASTHIGEAIPNATQPQAVTGMIVDAEHYFLYDRSPLEDPNCLNEDDSLSWSAAGSLGPGESFTFTPQHPSCQNRAFHGTFVFTGKRRQDHPNIQVTVSAVLCLATLGCPPPSTTVTDDGVQRTTLNGCGYTRTCWKGSWCLFYDASMNEGGQNTWTLTMKNTGTIPAFDVHIFGVDQGAAVVGGYPECA